MDPMITVTLLINMETIDVASLTTTSSPVAMCVEFNVSTRIGAPLAQQSVLQSPALSAGGLGSTTDHSTATSGNMKEWEWNGSDTPFRFACDIHPKLPSKGPAPIATIWLSAPCRKPTCNGRRDAGGPCWGHTPRVTWGVHTPAELPRKAPYGPYKAQHRGAAVALHVARAGPG